MSRKTTVLVAEDERQAREVLRQLLEEEGYRVLCAADGDEALSVLCEGRVEAALLDLRMPGRDGLAVLRALQGQADAPAVLVMTAYGGSSVAIEAMTLGAYDYLTKPVRVPELLLQLERAVENRRRLRDLAGYRGEEAAVAEQEIVGNSAPMRDMYKLIGQVAPTDSTVLIRGESGTGKELVARALHRHSRRGERRLVAVNCASIPEPLLEAELFGHERGAFTGAAQRRLGKLEYASGGTVFLDEVGELSPGTQAKLLRVLQERTIERLGSNIPTALDIRILAATHRDLAAAMRSGAFREDLYYRLHVVTIAVPPLRERREDIPELARSLVRRVAARLRLPSPVLSDAALALLERRDWPGNVRELEHSLERALVLARGGVIGPEHVEHTVVGLAPDPFGAVPLDEGLHESVARLERRLVERALQAASGNRTRAAELLRIHRRLLYDKLRQLGLE